MGTYTIYSDVRAKAQTLATKGKSMLARFEVENFKGFKARTVFDLSETKNYEFNSDCVQNDLVNKAMVYGRNGCGKSNLGLAIFDLSTHLTDNQATPPLYNNYLHADAQSDTAKFKYVFEFGKTAVVYSYEKKSPREVVSESLTVDGVEVVNLSKQGQFVNSLKGAESLKTDLKESNISALKYIKSNAVLDNDVTNAAVNLFFDFVERMLFYRAVTMGPAEFIGYESGITNILHDIAENGHIGDLEKLLNDAGVKCKLTMIESNGKKSIGVKFNKAVVNLMEIASTGTKPLILHYFWMQHLAQKQRNASFIFIDEFDANYHHELAAMIVEQLKKLNSQVVLTTHDTSIMSNDLMRPDCCFVMSNKIKPLYKLTDKELRFAHNIEKMYRAGAFNA